MIAVKRFNGRDALLRVRNGKPNTDGEHHVPTESGLRAQPNFFADLPPQARRLASLSYVAMYST
jgi:hypothetical protein